MSSHSDIVRAHIAVQSASEARNMINRLIRRIARKAVYEYATEHYITDFQDPVLVMDRHRTKRTEIIAVAQVRAVAVTSASDMGELLTVFDTFSDEI